MHLVGFVETVSRSQSFSHLFGIVVLDEGVFCADCGKHCIWKVDPSSGTASCFAGVEGNSGFVDGSSTTAKFYGPRGLAVSPSKSSIYVTDFETGRIRKVQLGDGAVSTVLGDCRFPDPRGIVATDDGRLLFSCWDCTIREIRIDTEPDSTSVAAGIMDESGDSDGRGSEAKFRSPYDLALGPDGSVYVADPQNSAIRKIGRDYEVETIGTEFIKSVGVAVDDEGNVYVSDLLSCKIYMLAPSGIQTVCGSGEKNSVDGSGALASLKQPQSLFYDSKSGFLYFTESKAVRRVKVTASTFRDPKLSTDLARLMNGSLPAGDTVFLVEGKSISVSTNLLCVRSEYFSSMFSSNWKEYTKEDTSESTPICIEDATYESFNAVITFLVTGCLEIQKHSHIIPDILVLADRYLVESLRDFCIAHLARRVSKETAFDYLSLAERFGFRELKKVAVHFVAKNFKTLCRDDNFAGLGGELLAEIVRAIASSS